MGSSQGARAPPDVAARPAGAALVGASPDHSRPRPQQQAPAGAQADVADGSSGASVATAGAESSSGSASSDRQPGHGAHADPSDRVFPVRSVVRVDPATRPPGDLEHFPGLRSGSLPGPARPRPAQNPRADAEAPRRRHAPSVGDIFSPMPPSPLPRRERNAGALPSVEADARRRGATAGPVSILFDPDVAGEPPEAEAPESSVDLQGSVAGESPGSASETRSAQGAYVTTRFQHVVTDEGHAVITGRDGKLQRCEDEPIHTPGAVQAFGLMIAIREDPDGRFSVRYASENAERIIGYSPRELFRLGSFLDILTDEQADNLLDHIDFIRDEDADPAAVGPEVFSISIKPPRRRTARLWCAIHISAAHPELVVCEFELEDDVDFPLRPPDEGTPDSPADTQHGNPTLEELAESTEILSRPLRVLRSARKRRGEAGAMQVFDIMSQVQEQLASAPTLDTFLKIVVGIVKELTGFHRVMVYQFDSSFNGKVVTELVDASRTRDLYKGLHFPASDIPRQARDLYRLNRVRLLYDRGQEAARLVCRSTEDLETPLDMTHSYLRAMSPTHLRYLENMAVRSSMSISINAFNELWGLISCHSYGGQGMRVSFPIRKMCRLLGDNVSRNIERLSYASRLQARKLINTVPTDRNPSGYIIASSDDLLRLFDADCGMLSIHGETKILGRMERSQEALAMLEYLRLRRFTSVLASQDITVEFPDLHYPPGFSAIAGLLYVPLSVGGNDFIVFFRRGQVREVRWAGNPYEKATRQGTEGHLEPRKSFKAWHETVLGKCREWSEEQVETAAVLCLVYGKFIEVWRQKEAALQSSRLTRLLLANSAHEVRTPLNAIINYLEIALEGSLDQETRDNLARSHSASKSLIYVINDLLDLTKTEEGQGLVKTEVFDLPACIREAADAFANDARRKGISYEVVEHPGLPRLVCGDPRTVRQAVSNITANAVEHTASGSVTIGLYACDVQDQHVQVEIVVRDTGRGMGNEKIDSLFRDLEQVSTELDEPERGGGGGARPSNARTLGLGLAVVARIVRNMNGQLRVKSEEGKGSMFAIQLPFELPSDGAADQPKGLGGDPGATPAAEAPPVAAVVPPVQEGEVTLVKRAGAAPLGNPALSEVRGLDDAGSIPSLRSGTSRDSIRSSKSDADRLIDAIQTPLELGEPEDEATSRQRRRSRGTTPGPASHPLLGASSAGPASPARGGDRPGAPARPASSPGRASALDTSAPAGVQFITGTRTPIKPVRVPDDDRLDAPAGPRQGEASRVSGEAPPQATRPAEQPTPQVPAEPAPESAELRVLIAEDDPINTKLLRKRLEKAGHRVCHTVNGEECASVYREAPNMFDVILMDMQMPIVDGLTSTRMIRALERRPDHAGLSPAAARHGRVPIFAVSASLVERDRGAYAAAGFDGWILKPVDFGRLNTLLLGIADDATRGGCLYAPGAWERGGWFAPRRGPPAPDAPGAPGP